MPKLKVDLIVDDQGSLVIKNFGRDVTSTFGRTAASAREMALGITAVVTGLAAAAYGAKRIIDIADAWTLVEGRLGLVTDSAEDLATTQRELFRLAQETRQEYQSTARLYTRLARATDTLAVTDRERLRVTEAINKAIIVSGASTAESSAAIIQLSQGLASGVLRGQELNSILEQTPRIAQMIAEGMGTTIGELRKMGAAGELTNERVFRALLDQAAKVDAEFAKMPLTVGQAMTKINNSLGKFVSEQNKSLSATESLAGGISDLADSLDELSMPISVLLDYGKEASSVLGLGVAESGLIGALLIGRKGGLAAVIGIVSVLNEQLKHFGLDIGSLPEKSQAFAASVNNIWEAMSGKRDWNTGEEIAGITEMTEALNTLGDAAEDVGKREAEMIKETMKTAERDQKVLKTRLSEYEKFYAELGKKIEQHSALERKTILELNDLYRQQMDLRRSTEDMLAKLGGGPQRSDAEQYAMTRSELDQQFEAAMTLDGRDQIKALEQYKRGVFELAQEFEKLGVANQAIADIENVYALQNEIMAELETATREQIETNRIWGDELAAESEKSKNAIAEVQQTITELDDHIKLMDQVLTIDADDRASSVVEGISRKIAELHDKTVTITTVYQTVGGGGGGSESPPVLDSFATGTGRILQDGPYYLHRNESVNTAAETSALSAGGGSYRLSSGGATFGDIHINLPPEAAPQKPEDWRRITRDYIIPELEGIRG